jgi:hypothetical protein
VPTSSTVVDLHDERVEGIAANLNVISGAKEVLQETNSSKKATPPRSGFPCEAIRFVTAI